MNDQCTEAIAEAIDAERQRIARAMCWQSQHGVGHRYNPYLRLHMHWHEGTFVRCSAGIVLFPDDAERIWERENAGGRPESTRTE